MLDSLRGGQRWIVTVIIGGIALIFVLFLGLQGPLTRGGGGGTIVTVGPYQFGFREFERARAGRSRAASARGQGPRPLGLAPGNRAPGARGPGSARRERAIRREALRGMGAVRVREPDRLHRGAPAGAALVQDDRAAAGAAPRVAR